MTRRLFWIVWVAPLLLFLALPLTGHLQEVKTTRLRFSIAFPESAGKTPLDGRLLLLVSRNNEKEPRFQISEDLTTQQVFGINVEGLKAGESVIIDNNAFGYPVKSLAQVPRGNYWVQALFHRYETFNRADGHTVKLPLDRGEGQQWNRAPGNLLSAPQELLLDPEQLYLVLMVYG